MFCLKSFNDCKRSPNFQPFNLRTRANFIFLRENILVFSQSLTLKEALPNIPLGQSGSATVFGEWSTLDFTSLFGWCLRYRGVSLSYNFVVERLQWHYTVLNAICQFLWCVPTTQPKVREMQSWKMRFRGIVKHKLKIRAPRRPTFTNFGEIWKKYPTFTGKFFSVAHGEQRQILVLFFNINYWQNKKQKYAMEKLKDIFNFIIKTCPKTSLLYYFSYIFAFLCPNL